MVLPSLMRQVMPGPVTQICCGCSVVVGVYFALALHLLLNAFFVVAAAADVIWLDRSWSYAGGNLPLEIWVGGYSLAGILVILAGFVGAFTKCEALVRAYWYYMVLTYVLSLIWTVWTFAFTMGCEHVPQALRAEGEQFVCGTLRIINVICIVVFVAVPANFIFIVHSYADRLAYCAESDLSDILTAKNRNASKRPWLEKAHREFMENEFDRYRSASYGAIHEPSEGFGGSRPIFNGSYHETTYPLGSSMP